jgi:hypothetical protein
MIAYLLGRLPADRAEVLEDAYIRDERLFSAISAVETELIHEYLRGGLSGSLREQFESAYLADASRAQRVAAEREWFEAARLVRQGDIRTPAAGRSWRLSVLLAPGGLIRLAAVAGFALVVLVLVRLDKRLTTIERTTQASRSASGERNAPPLPVASFVLTPGRVRGAGAPERLLVPSTPGLVRFDLRLDEQVVRKSWEAKIGIVGGPEVWSGVGKQAGDTVSIEVPSTAFSRNDYEIALQGMSPDGRIEQFPKYLLSAVQSQ